MNKPAMPRSGSSRRPGRGQRCVLFVRLARRARDLIADWAQAQRRLAELTTAPDRFVFKPDRAPDTYEEFLFRTSGLMRHEPPARARITR